MPYVSLGLAVYNGEDFLSEAIESILAQTFEDFELIISDNASTDGTDAICKRYAARDQRIRYYRNERNMGSSWNYNRVFELSSGKYFKWANDDDLIAPDFLAKCVKVLDQKHDVVLCHSKTRIIDERGRKLMDVEISFHTDSPEPHIRYCEVLKIQIPLQIFGLIRASTLSKIPPMGSYCYSDGVLVARLALLGPFHEIPEYLFCYRKHSKQLSALITPDYLTFLSEDKQYTKDMVPDFNQLISHHDPAKEGKIIFPYWRMMREIRKSITESPISWGEKIRCFRTMRKQFKKGERFLFLKLLVRDVIIAVKMLLTQPKSVSRNPASD